MGNGIVVIGATFVDIKGFPHDLYLPTGRNVGHIEYIHGGVARNVAEDIANVVLIGTPDDINPNVEGLDISKATIISP